MARTNVAHSCTTPSKPQKAMTACLYGLCWSKVWPCGPPFSVTTTEENDSSNKVRSELLAECIIPKSVRKFSLHIHFYVYVHCPPSMQAVQPVTTGCCTCLSNYLILYWGFVQQHVCHSHKNRSFNSIVYLTGVFDSQICMRVCMQAWPSSTLTTPKPSCVTCPPPKHKSR